MAIVAKPAPAPAPLKVRYSVRASQVETPTKLATYMVGEPDCDRAAAKANDLWNYRDIAVVELTCETTTLIGRKTRPQAR